MWNSHCSWMKRTDEFHHNTEEVSTYCRVIYVVLVRPKVSDEDWSHNMLPVSYTITWEHLVELSLKLLKVENSPWGGGGGDQILLPLSGTNYE